MQWNDCDTAESPDLSHLQNETKKSDHDVIPKLMNTDGESKRDVACNKYCHVHNEADICQYADVSK